MYAYIDETGNTGNNLFDLQQPVFMSGALITKTNFDILYAKIVKELAKYSETGILHANELGLDRIDLIVNDFIKILKKSDARIYIARADKRKSCWEIPPIRNCPIMDF